MNYKVLQIVQRPMMFPTEEIVDLGIILESIYPKVRKYYATSQTQHKSYLLLSTKLYIKHAFFGAYAMGRTP